MLHNGKIAEMKTGEGKTLVATLAAYLNYLDGKAVHIVTVNDYLAKRDCEDMSKIYNLLGLSSGFINNGQKVTRNYVKRQHTWWSSTNLRIHQQIKRFPDEIDINSMNFN